MPAESNYKRRQDTIMFNLMCNFAIDQSLDGEFGYNIIRGDENSNAPDIIAIIDNKITVFVFIDEIEKATIENRLKSIPNKFDNICMVIFNSRHRAELIKIVPKSVGIICYSNSFGYGMVFQIMRWFK